MTYQTYDKICTVVSHIENASSAIVRLNAPGFDSGDAKKVSEHIAALLFYKPYLPTSNPNTEFANRLKALLKEYLAEQESEFENL